MFSLHKGDENVEWIEQIQCFSAADWSKIHFENYFWKYDWDQHSY